MLFAYLFFFVLFCFYLFLFIFLSMFIANIPKYSGTNGWIFWIFNEQKLNLHLLSYLHEELMRSMWCRTTFAFFVFQLRFVFLCFVIVASQLCVHECILIEWNQPNRNYWMTVSNRIIHKYPYSLIYHLFKLFNLDTKLVYNFLFFSCILIFLFWKKKLKISIFLFWICAHIWKCE